MKKIILLLLIFALFQGCSKKFKLDRDDPLSESPWQYPGKNTASTAFVAADIDGDLSIKWESSVGDGPVSPLTIIGKTLIVTGGRRHIYFLDLETGQTRGKYNLMRNAETGMITEDSIGYYAIGYPDNRFYAQNLFTRKKLWSRNLKDVSGAPIILDNRLYVGSGTGMILCLDKLTGETVWQDSTGQIDKKNRSIAGPSGESGMALFPKENGDLIAYNAENGEQLFASKLDFPIMSKVAIDSHIFVTDIGGTVCAVDKADGSIVWKRNSGAPIWSSPAVDENSVYVSNNGGEISAFNKENGEPLWRFNTGAVVKASPIVVGEFVFVGDLKGSFYCLNKSDGSLVSMREFKDEFRFGAVSDGRYLYAAAGDGNILCFGK